MVSPKSLLNLRPKMFTSETAKIAAAKSALARRKIPLAELITVPDENPSQEDVERFGKARLVRVRKQMLLLDRAFELEAKRNKPDMAKVNKIIVAQERLWEYERKLSGQSLPKTPADPSKSVAQTAAPVV